MRRPLFNLATVASLLLCLATTALAARSYWHGLRISLCKEEWLPPDDFHEVVRDLMLVQGRWEIVKEEQRRHYRPRALNPEIDAYCRLRPARTWAETDFRVEPFGPPKYSQVNHHFVGFYYLFDSMTQGPEALWFSVDSTETCLVVPAWASMALLLILPTIRALHRYREIPKRQPGRCRA